MEFSAVVLKVDANGGKRHERPKAAAALSIAKPHLRA
jgi:hypothetical protein